MTFMDGLLDPRTIRRGLCICLAVGTILTLVNQWDNLTGQHMLYPWQTLFTYVVPFIVSTFSSASAQASLDQVR